MSPSLQLVGLAQKARVAGVPATEHHGVRRDIAELHARARIIEWMGYLLATKAAKGAMTAADAPTAKVLNSELGLDLHEYGIALHGGDGLLHDAEAQASLWRWQDTFLYARAYMIGGGTNEINRNLVAERGLGLPR